MQGISDLQLANLAKSRIIYGCGSNLIQDIKDPKIDYMLVTEYIYIYLINPIDTMGEGRGGGVFGSWMSPLETSGGAN